MAKQKTNWDSLIENVNQNEWYNSILENKVIFSLGIALLLVVSFFAYGIIGGDSKAPDFTLTDTEGNTFSLSDYNGKKVVILDFMYTTCSPCEDLAKGVLEPYSEIMDNNDVIIISISVFGTDDEGELKEYAKDYGWIHALGDKDGDLEKAYGVKGTPKLVIIDKEGQINFAGMGANVPDTCVELDSEVNNALTGQGSLVKVKDSSIYIFAIGAGVMVFFSPCSFPMLPGYMSFYLANKKQRVGEFNEKAARETLPDGLAAAAGLMGVLLLIGILLIPFVNIIGGFIPWLELIVGILILTMGIVMVMEYNSDKIVRPFKDLMATVYDSKLMIMLKNGIESGIKVVTGKEFSFTNDEAGTRTGLFWYGVAYGSAAAGCVAPVVVGLLSASINKGIITGLLVFIVFSATSGILMVSFTIMVAASESTIVEKLKASTRQIEMAGGTIMIIVGIYLMYYFLTTVFKQASESACL